jgi:hypothetical protein
VELENSPYVGDDGGPDTVAQREAKIASFGGGDRRAQPLAVGLQQIRSEAALGNLPQRPCRGRIG